jgi:hypothetical protein
VEPLDGRHLVGVSLLVRGGLEAQA